MIEIWKDGRRATQVGALDRGLQYGDGLFETMRVRAHRIALLELHLDRLADSCRRLSLPMPAERTLRADIARAARRWPESVVKLIITRGTGERGYRTPASCRPLRLLVAERRADTTGPTKHATTDVRVRLCATPLSDNPALAGMKTLNRLDSVLARSEWRGARIAEGLMLDCAGRIVCGTMTNVFAAVRGTLVTPLLDRCGVAGVMRRWVLEHASQLGVSVAEGRLKMADLDKAEEILLTNAVVGIWSVRTLSLPGGVVRPPGRARADALRAAFQLFQEGAAASGAAPR